MVVIFIMQIHKEMSDNWHMLKYFLQTAHKKTFYYLEQLILKHKLHSNALNIKEMHGMSSTRH